VNFWPFSKRATIQQASTQATNDLFARPTSSGVSITSGNAMQISTVFSCIRVLGESVGGLPLHLIEEKDGKKNKAKNHPLYNILYLQPNNETVAFNYYETIIAHLCLRGNHYSQIVRDRAGRIIELIPLNPASVTKSRIENGDIKYFYQNGTIKRIFDKHEIFDVLGLSLDGFTGVSPISYQRESLGLSKATEQYGAKYFDNNAKPSGILEIPETLSEDAYQRLSKSWNDRHGGIANSNKTALLEGGAKWKQISLSNEDSQFLDTRKFQRSEICGIFRVPPHMIADLEKATFSNIEHQSIEFAIHSLRPYLVRIEQAISSQLLSATDRVTYYPKFNMEGLLRGDTKSRYESYNLARNMGVMSANDIREKEDLNPIENGDIYLQPMNMVEAGKEIIDEQTA